MLQGHKLLGVNTNAPFSCFMALMEALLLIKGDDIVKRRSVGMLTLKGKSFFVDNRC